MNGKLCFLAFATAVLFKDSHAATINNTPSNSSGLLGGNATIYCEVTGTQAQGENLQWRKLTPDSVFIGNDASPSNTTKYEVMDKYRLYIKDLTLTDEGSFQCMLFPDTHTVWVTVSDPPTSATLMWSNGRDYTAKGQTANLTCSSTSSHPPATFRWFRGSTEVTSQALNPTPSTDSNGYGTSESNMELTPTREGDVYKCHVDVPGAQSQHTKELAVRFSGSANVAANIALVLAAIAVAFRL